MTHEEAVTTLRVNNFGVVEDDSAVIVISENGRQERTALNYRSTTIARRYDSPQVAVRRLKLTEAKDNEND